MIIDRDPILLAAKESDAPPGDFAEFPLAGRELVGRGDRVPAHER
jgi:hypothetical protein